MFEKQQQERSLWIVTRRRSFVSVENQRNVAWKNTTTRAANECLVRGGDNKEDTRK